MKKIIILSVILVTGTFCHADNSVEDTTSKYNSWVKVLSPNGLDTFTSGETINVTWENSKNLKDIKVGYELAEDTSFVWFMQGDHNVGLQEWKINIFDKTVVYPVKAKIVIVCKDKKGLSFIDKSDNYFIIREKH